MVMFIYARTYAFALAYDVDDHGHLVVQTAAPGLAQVLNVCGRPIPKKRDCSFHRCIVECMLFYGTNERPTGVYLLRSVQDETLSGDVTDRGCVFFMSEDDLLEWCCFIGMPSHSLQFLKFDSRKKKDVYRVISSGNSEKWVA